MKKAVIGKAGQDVYVECPHCQHCEQQPVDQQRHHLQTFTIKDWVKTADEENEVSHMECSVCKEEFLLKWDYSVFKKLQVPYEVLAFVSVDSNEYEEELDWICSHVKPTYIDPTQGEHLYGAEIEDNMVVEDVEIPEFISDFKSALLAEDSRVAYFRFVKF